MARETLTRAAPTDLEIRGDGRTIEGIAAPFDQPTEVGNYVERFAPGCFARTIRERGNKVKLLAHHHRDEVLGRAIELREDRAGLFGRFRVAKTTAGDEVLELIREGALDALSVGFEPIRDQWSANRTEVARLEVRLLEVSTVAFPAYSGAAIEAVRHNPTPDLATITHPGQRLALLRSGPITTRNLADASLALARLRK